MFHELTAMLKVVFLIFIPSFYYFDFVKFIVPVSSLALVIELAVAAGCTLHS